MKKKLAIITSHPIQYNDPWFALLNREGIVEPKVFYTWSQTKTEEKFDPGFGKVVKWDIPLLEGYDYKFVNNISTEPGTHHFKGLINPTLINEIEAWQPDAVLVFGWAFHSHLRCIRYFHKKKTVLFRGDSTLLDETGGIKKFLRRIFLKWVYSHITAALYAGTNNKKYFLAHGLKEKQLLYAPHAIDNARFQEGENQYLQQAAQRKKDLGFSEDDVVLLFAGKLEQKKNPFLLIDTLKKIKDKKLKLLFAGNGALEKKLKEAAKADERIVFLDFQNQQAMPVVYRMADIFVLPSSGPGETWGLALNEAMACGKAVVASGKAGGTIDLVQENVNGIIINDNDTAAFEQLLLKALKNKDVLTAMGSKSKEMIKRFSFENITEPLTVFMNKL